MNGINNNERIPSSDSDLKNVRREIHDRLLNVMTEAMSSDHCLPIETIKELMLKRVCRRKTRPWSLSLMVTSAIIIVVVAIIITMSTWTSLYYFIPSSSRCLLENNFLVREATRPPTDCRICINVTGVQVLDRTIITQDVFAEIAYSGRPVLAKGAALDWPAMNTFNFDFFRRLYITDDGRLIDGALDSVEDECQFFPFWTKFITLADVFSMNRTSSEPWYIGWSNCNPRVADILRKHYSRPHFLPEDSESSAIDWIFMGSSGQGASLHLDYVQRPSWQSQISGRKTWRLFPVPECEDVCGSFQITVEKGDIVLVDTNQWYHDTFIEPGEMSITIGSEYD